MMLEDLKQPKKKLYKLYYCPSNIRKYSINGSNLELDFCSMALQAQAKHY